MKKPLALFKKSSSQFIFSTYWCRTALVTLLCTCLASVASAQVTKQWDKTFGGSERESLSKMIPTADGGYLLGGTSSSD